MEYTELIQARYSCKKYDGRPVEQEKLDAILEAGRVAPTAKNGQVQRIYVIRSAEGLAKIDSVTPCRYGAPVVLAVAYDKKEQFTYPGGAFNSGAEDVTIVATHMMLGAKNVGVESCWLNNFDPTKAAEVLGLPEDQVLVMLLDLGYPAEGGHPLPNHGKRKPLSETVKYL